MYAMFCLRWYYKELKFDVLDLWVISETTDLSLKILSQRGLHLGYFCIDKNVFTVKNHNNLYIIGTKKTGY